MVNTQSNPSEPPSAERFSQPPSPVPPGRIIICTVAIVPVGIKSNDRCRPASLRFSVMESSLLFADQLVQQPPEVRRLDRVKPSRPVFRRVAPAVRRGADEAALWRLA